MSFIHYYRCHCKDWTTGHWVTESSNNNKPKYNGESHRLLVPNTRCSRLLRWSHTQAVIQNQVNAPGSYGQGKVLLMAYAGKSKFSTVAVMWDPHTQQWYYGHSKHEKGQGHVPGVIWNYITTRPVQKDSWSFGQNCAEVACVIKAYANGRLGNDLRDCSFMAMKAREKRFYGACGSCSDWIKHFFGTYHNPN
jgi:hypothetical protein